MPFLSHLPVAGHPRKPCACTGPCTGYDTRSNCPPLIVLAVSSASQPAIPAKGVSR